MSLSRTDVAVPEPQPDPTAEQLRPDSLEVGQWFWVRAKEPDRESEEHVVSIFCCIVHLGSNFARLQSLPRRRYGCDQTYETRVHFDEFYEVATWVPNAQEVIDGYLAHHQSNLNRHMRAMKEATARLAIAPQRELHAEGTETQALSTSLSEMSHKDYKDALIRARDQELPAIFKAIKEEHAKLASWMSAQLIPMQAEASKLETVTESIKSRIFNVELYAGLIEELVLVKDGKPASIDTPISPIQRRHYMDEECLSHYQVGGMQFRHIKEFDEWVARPDNRDRLLPFQRCVVAFRVRRYNIERHCESLSDFFQLMDEREQDRKTFLYIRNGEQLYRLSTGIDFGAHLFPDIDREKLGGVKLWAVYGRSHSHIETLITDHAHREQERAHVQCLREHEERKAAWQSKYDAATPEQRREDSELWYFRGRAPAELLHEPFDKSSVYYDDMRKFVQDQIDAHNRIALVFQGLLDRSPAFHPHPPWQLWTDEGFTQAFNLVFDDSRALTPGEAPDFEAYRARLNRDLKPGCVTIGQQALWQEAEREAFEEKYPDSYSRERRRYRYVPHMNLGPGRLAKLADYKRSSSKCVYKWTRKSERCTKRFVPNPNRLGWGHYERDYADIQATFTCETKDIFNVSAYRPGDFKQFFNDPRTRAQYRKWAPILLAAEEYHAGNEDGRPKRRDEERTSSVTEPEEVAEGSEDPDAEPESESS